jgi:hypothetical protein
MFVSKAVFVEYIYRLDEQTSRDLVRGKDDLPVNNNED